MWDIEMSKKKQNLIAAGKNTESIKIFDRGGDNDEKTLKNLRININNECENNILSEIDFEKNILENKRVIQMGNLRKNAAKTIERNEVRKSGINVVENIDENAVKKPKRNEEGKMKRNVDRKMGRNVVIQIMKNKKGTMMSGL